MIATSAPITIEQETLFNGRAGYAQKTRFPVFGSEGSVAAVGTIMTDITERRTTLMALADAEQRYRHIFEHASEGIFQSSRAGKSRNVAGGVNSGVRSAALLVGDDAVQLGVDDVQRTALARLIVARQRLFVAALGNHSVEVVDLMSGKPIRSLGELGKPQSVVFSASYFTCKRKNHPKPDYA